ncbi:MAG: hypothetical protein EZS28_046624, partial [Streblomastix strix]
KAISLQLQRAKMPKELKPYTLKHIGVSKAGQHGIDKQTINEQIRWTKDSIMFDKRKKLKSKQNAKMKVNFKVRAVRMRGPFDQNNSPLKKPMIESQNEEGRSMGRESSTGVNGYSD